MDLSRLEASLSAAAAAVSDEQQRCDEERASGASSLASDESGYDLLSAMAAAGSVSQETAEFDLDEPVYRSIGPAAAMDRPVLVHANMAYSAASSMSAAGAGADACLPPLSEEYRFARPGNYNNSEANFGQFDLPGDCATTVNVSLPTKTASSAPTKRKRPMKLTHGFPIERTHFSSDAEDADSIAREIQKALDAARAVSEFNADKYKFKCQLCIDNAAVHFIIRVYTARAGANGRFVVEFQRRSGSVMAWSQIVDSAYESLSALISPTCPSAAGRMKAGKNQNDKQKRRRCRSMSALELPEDWNTTPLTELNSETSPLSPLVDMVRSPRQDIRCEASRAVANICARAEDAATVAGDGALVAALIAVATETESGDFESRRCAFSALAGLAEADPVIAASGRITRDRLEALRAGLSSSVASCGHGLADRGACPLMRRECARALMQMSSRYPQAMGGETVDLLSAATGYDDPTLAEMSTAALQNLMVSTMG